MKNLFILLVLAAGVLFITACEETELDPAELSPQITDQFSVPDIPPEFTELMRPEDIAMFRAGPGDAYTDAVRTRSLYGHAQGPARWHPILFYSGYDMQFVPFGGTSCDPGEFYICPEAPDIGACFANPLGVTGIVQSDAKWLGSDIHAVYFPVLCAVSANSFAGYGQGYWEAFDKKLTGENKLFSDGEHEPTYTDAEGNSILYINLTFRDDLSTGIFEGAFGWATAIVSTSPENDPANDPNGLGSSEAVHFGWVFF